MSIRKPERREKSKRYGGSRAEAEVEVPRRRFLAGVDFSPAAISISLHLLLRSERALSDRDIGEVVVPLAELLVGVDFPSASISGGVVLAPSVWAQLVTGNQGGGGVEETRRHPARQRAGHLSVSGGQPRRLLPVGPERAAMAESETSNSDDDSMYEEEGRDDNVARQGQNTHMADVISSNNGGEGCSTRNTRHGHKTAGRSSNKQTEAPATTNALSRCNHSYFKNIILSLDQRRKDVVRYYDFPVLLEFDCCSVPRHFVEWIADHIDENCMDIHASGKIIPITPLSMHKALGLHLGGPDIAETGESDKEDFLKLFQVKNIDDTCYAVGAVHEEQVQNLRQGLEERFGYLPGHMIDGLCCLHEDFLLHNFRPPHYTPDKLGNISVMQDMTQCTASMKNPEENMNEANQSINDLSSDNQNLSHGGINEAGAEDDIVTDKDVDNTIAESGGANGASEATVIVGSQNSGSKDDVSSQGKKMTESLAVLNHGNGASQDTPTIIIETQKSYSKDEVISPRKRKRKGRACISSPESLDSVASRTRHKLATKSIGKSPLCQTTTASNVEVKKTLYMLKMLGSKEQVQSKTKSPYFNSPSVPPFRIFDDEDDLGNYVADPRKRRPVGESGPTLPRQDVLIMESLPLTDETSKEFAKRLEQLVPLALEMPGGEYVDLLFFPIFFENHWCVIVAIIKEWVWAVLEPCLRDFGPDSAFHQHVKAVCCEKLQIAAVALFLTCLLSHTSLHPTKYKAISPIVPVEQPVPLALEMPGGEYVDLSQESPEVAAVIARKTFSEKCSELSNESAKMKYIIDYKNVRVKFGSLGSSLRPGGKVETCVVNALCKKIFDKLHARRSLKHFFFTPDSDFLLNNYDFKNEEERRKIFSKAVSSFKGANAASLLYNSELLFFPIFFENHWCVIVAIIKEWVWAVLEPCLRDFGPDSAFHQHVKAVLGASTLVLPAWIFPVQ
ncbi:hypothetical protein PR202_ga22046 [Eleusine coracana subsp. coracana]|uniref:Ubiquitin-like protease family profile domain-containing protein n=1 Tax=Eleusine coracana subsp. coracana TaxID=191504 RepID=A0AAV5D383_ELECO|nr:hypothetical protein PR202_ga22046 [Eleusine coracana subsp. coracana]